MKTYKKSILVLEAIFVFFLTIAFLPAHINAGSLEPDGPPGPTMKTLDEIYQAITPLPTGFVLCEVNPRFAGWNNNTLGDPSDDVVLDRATELMWARDANLYGPKSWQFAIDDCSSLFLGNRTDWRVPSLDELVSLTEPFYSDSPALPSGHPFENVQLSFYWSSTTYSNNTNDAWRVSLDNGDVNNNNKTMEYYVWCVRGVR